MEWANCSTLTGTMFGHECKKSCRSNGCDRDPKTRQAKNICYGCPVMGECRVWAITTCQRFGITGGMTAYERIRLRQALRRNGFPLKADDMEGTP